LKIIVKTKGGPHSGNFDHAGIPGHQGGSAPTTLRQTPIITDRAILQDLDSVIDNYHSHMSNIERIDHALVMHGSNDIGRIISGRDCGNNSVYTKLTLYPKSDIYAGYVIDLPSGKLRTHVWNVQDGKVIDSTFGRNNAYYYGRKISMDIDEDYASKILQDYSDVKFNDSYDPTYFFRGR